MAALVASLTRVCGGMAATLGTLFMCVERVQWWGGRTLDRRGGMTKAAMERGKGESLLGPRPSLASCLLGRAGKTSNSFFTSATK